MPVIEANKGLKPYLAFLNGLLKPESGKIILSFDSPSVCIPIKKGDKTCLRITSLPYLKARRIVLKEDGRVFEALKVRPVRGTKVYDEWIELWKQFASNCRVQKNAERR